MKALIRSKLVLTLAALLMIAAAVAVPLALSGGHSHAAPPKARHGANANLSALKGQPNSSLSVTLGNPTISLNPRDDGHLLYVDDGNCPGPGTTGDLIDVYKIHPNGLVHVGSFPTGGCFDNTFYGTQDIDTTPANGTHGPCLVYIDDTNGFVDSFTILSTGALGPQVSHLANSGTNDVHISLNGKLVYVDSTFASTPQLESYSLGKGCALTALVTLPVSQFYISFALINATRLVTADSNNITIDTYALTSTGGISLLNSVPGQISSPDSVAVQTTHISNNDPTDVFTGQATDGPPQAQGGRETLSTGAITFLTGSPASDPSGVNGAAVFSDNDHRLLIQAEQFSSTLGVYKITGGQPGSMAFLDHTPLAVAGTEPTAFARRDNALFVAAGTSGDVEVCLIQSSTGVSGCATAAILTDITGFQGGIVTL